MHFLQFKEPDDAAHQKEHNLRYRNQTQKQSEMGVSTEFLLLSLTEVPPQPLFVQRLWIKQCLIHVVFVYRVSVCLRARTE